MARSIHVGVEALESRRLLAAGDPLISEFLAINNSGLTDQNGDRSDWIEIHNPGSSPVNLNGWRLTDNASNLGKWVFPSVQLPAGGYLVVFASDKNRATAGQELHTNFKLDGDGEYLALVTPDGTVVSEFAPAYPRQLADVSYGRSAAGGIVQNLVDEVASARILIPQDDSLGLSWTGAASFDDSAWIEGATPVGFDLGTDFGSLIETDIQAEMFGIRASAYIRIPFLISDPGEYSSLLLRMRYDDGFIAYLNGMPIASRNAPQNPSASSSATASNPDEAAVVFEEMDVSQHLGLLRAGENVLAVHGLNFGAGSGDFLISPMLVGDATIAPDPEYYTTPTPGAANSAGALGIVKDTKFSVDRGFYDEPFQVQITTETAGAQIRYTLDGSKPTATTGLVYAGPITIGTTTTLRAAAFRPGFIPTNVDSQTYIFLDDVIRQTGVGLPPHANWGHSGPDWEMDPDVVNSPIYRDTIKDDLLSVPSIHLSLPFADLFGAGGQGIYIAGSSIERAVSVELINPDGSRGFQVNAAVEVQGGTSTNRWKDDKLSLQLIFKEPYGPTKLNYPLFGEDATDSFDTIILDSVLNFSWLHPESGQRGNAKYIQDQFVADLQNATGGAAPHARYFHLYLAGMYWGMYYVHERPDDSFAATYLGGDKDDYDVMKHRTFSVVAGSNANYLDLLARVRRSMTVEANYQAVLDVLDVESFIDYMIVNFYVGNTDWAHQNWYASFNRVDPEGKWRFHSWDAEHVLKSVNENVTGKNDSGGPTEIHQRLTANADYRNLFADRVHKHFFNDGAMTPERARAMYQARVDEVDRAIVGESARWGDNRRASLPYTRHADWRPLQDNLLNNYFPNRTAIVLGQFRARNLYPNVEAPIFSQHGGSFDGAYELIVGHPNASGVIHYTIDGSDPRTSGQVYSGPITIGRSAVVKARVLSGGTWSALNEATFVIGPPPPLRITEIMYNPPIPEGSSLASESFEFLELQNLGDEPIDVGGLAFTRGISFTFAAGTMAAAGERIVLVSDPVAFRARYGDQIPIHGVYTGQLSDSGENLTLTTPFGQVVQDIRYNDNWFAITDGGGYSLVARNALADDATLSSKQGWRPSNPLYGGPGAADPGVDPGAILVNEALTHSNGTLGDWIELHNTTNEPIEIGGWFLSDSDKNLQKYQIQPNTVVPANGYIVFSQVEHFGSTANPGTSVAFGLSELGEEIYLSSNDGSDVGGYREKQGFGASEREVTLGRHVKSTGGTDFTAMLEPTPGAANSVPLIGPVIINELMYHPPAGGTEYIELRNLTSAPVALYDPLHPANRWRFTDGVSFTFPANAEIPALGYALVVPIDPADFRSANNIPASVPVFGPYTGALDNAGENIALSRPGVPELDGVVPYYVVDRVNYGNAAPWPDAPHGAGASLIRVNPPGYGNDVANWDAEDGGSPGRANAGADSEAPTVQIVAVAPDPRDVPVDSIFIVFSEPVSGFDLSDLSLSRDGGANLLGAGQTLASVDGVLWTLRNLSPLTFLAGDYTLSLTAAGSGIVDLAGIGLEAGAVESFQVWTTSIQARSEGGSLYARLSGSGIEVFLGNGPGGEPAYVVPLDSAGPLVIEGDEGDDELILDLSAGNAILAGGIIFNGGDQVTESGDRLVIIGDGAMSGTYTPSAAETGSGSVTIGGGTISFTGLEPVTISNFPSFTLVTPSSTDNILIDMNETGDRTQVSGTSGGIPFESLIFSGVGTFMLDTGTNDAGGSGDDMISITEGVAVGGLDLLRVFVGGGANVLSISGGTLQLELMSNSSLEMNASGDASVHLVGPQHFASLAIADSARVHLEPGGEKVLRTAGLSIGSGAVLDLHDNALIVDASTANREAILAMVENLIASARNSGGWDGDGISSATARDDLSRLTGLAVLLNDNGSGGTVLTEFAGRSVDANAILVRHTWNGDLDLNGMVDIDDYFLIDVGFLAFQAGAIPMPVYRQGDLNFDDLVDIDDYFLIDTAFLGQDSVL